tara:strand:- start:297 stop:836 length:540 start_codon:yes stop_codon:yes gene_type:complete
MKVNKHLKIDAITNSTGRLPRDMENLEIYHYSSSKKEPINVGEMDLTYLIRAFAKCQRTLMENSPTEQYHDLHGKIAKLEEMLEEKDEIIEKLVKSEAAWKDRFFQEVSYKGDRMMFKDIPNDESGWAFVDQMKKHLNKDTYKIRVKGQYLIDGEDWRKHSYGQPISKSKCLRVYVYKL